MLLVMISILLDFFDTDIANWFECRAAKLQVLSYAEKTLHGIESVEIYRSFSEKVAYYGDIQRIASLSIVRTQEYGRRPTDSAGLS